MPPILKLASSYLSRLWNRQLLVFLFFLLLSTIFWIFTAGKEVKEKEFDIAVELVGVPKNVVITTEPPKKISLTLKDEVFTLINYQINRQRDLKIVLNWNELSPTGGHVKITTATLLKPLAAQLYSTTQIVAHRPDVIEIFYNYGLSKTVDVVLQGIIQADSTSYVIASDVSPRKVTVYGSKEMLDTVTGAYLKPVNLRDLRQKESVTVQIQPVKGLKFVPDHVTLTVYADEMMESTVQVPVRGVNFPAGKSLCTFPPKVTVTYNAGKTMSKDITADAFTIVLNYEDLINHPDNRCSLQLKSLPAGVKSARISPSEVEFIIEEDANYDSEASDEEPAKSTAAPAKPAAAKPSSGKGSPTKK